MNKAGRTGEKTASATRRSARAKRPTDECTIPPPPVKHILASYILTNRADERSIRDYVEWQARGEKVQHAEKIKTERVFDRTYDCWDVHTQKDRYWVITAPTNLYSQTLFPSLDYTLSFHVGVMARVSALHRSPTTNGERMRLTAVWRRWEEAADALDAAEEAEEFQAVGMRCRECLIQLVRALGHVQMVPTNQDAPKRSDVVGWAELIANTVAGGPSAEHVRSYLKAVAKNGWQLANWLTHAADAARSDAAFVLDATQAVLSSFGSAVMRYESGSPDRCPQCGSYKIAVGYNPELSPQYISACEKCDWSSAAPDAEGAHA